jgi:hypothetical protein
MLDILQENIRIVDELNKLTGGKEQWVI